MCPSINCTVCFKTIGRTIVGLLDCCVVVTKSCNVEEAAGSANDSVVSPVNGKGKDGNSDNEIGKLTDS